MLWLYRLALRALPAHFRQKYAAEMETAFREALTARRGFDKLTALATGLVDVARARHMLGRAAVPAPVRRPKTMEPFLNDVAFALRALVKRRGFALIALLTLALGIGSVTAVFSIVNGVLLQSLPYAASERIVILWHDLGNGAQSLPALNPLDLFDYRERGRGFEDWTIATGSPSILGDAEEPSNVDVGRVAQNFFLFFGVDPLLGRHFAPNEDVPGGPKVALLSHRLWLRRFGGEASIVGETIRLGGEDHEVLGVLPASFRLLLPAEAFRLRDAEIWTPAQIDEKRLPPRNYTGYTGFAKLEPGVGLESAQREMDRLEAELKAEHAVHQAANLQVRAVPLHGDVVKRARPTLYVLLAAVGLVLLIACGNTAQLLLARWRGGERELSVRAAMGASRWRLIRLVLMESVVLSLAAGLLGFALAGASVALIRSYASASVPRIDDVALDANVLIFAVAISFVTAILFSVLPALALSRANLAATLAESGRGSSSARHVRARNTLIVVEVALSVVLLVATGLTIRSFQALLESDPGFEHEGLLTLRVSLPSPEFAEPSRRRLFDDEIRRRIATLPGVDSVASVNQLPLSGSGTLQPYAYDEETATNWESVTADERYVSPGFFEAMGATLLAGRDFTEDDLRLERKVTVIDESLAEIAFPGESAIGKLVRVEPLGHEDPFTEVIGVAAHLKLHDLARATLPQFYFPAWPRWSFDLVIRSDADPEALAPPVRREVRALAPGAALEDVIPMTRLVEEARAPARFSLVLMLGFGAVALSLAAVGLFGVVAYSVSTRRVELGIRMALGASPSGIRRRVLTDTATLLAASLALGLPGAVLLSRSLSRVLYGVPPGDVATYAAVAAVIATVALAASWAPARRATRVDPARVLRSE